jgi:enoyl-CoA hydratase/carnithine racemase
MPVTHKNIVYEEKGKVGLLTFNRPEKRNALSLALLNELASCLAEAGQQRKVRAIILRGAGPVFSAGHDMAEILGQGLNDIRQLFQTCVDLMTLMHSIPQPVIAQVHGVATAAGCQLVAACDLAVAEEGARFSTPGVRIGLFCVTPMVALSRTVGRKRALEMLLTGDVISAQDAMNCGLINRVVPAERLEEEAYALAAKIAQYSLVTLGLGKRAFYQQIEMTEAQAFHYAKELISANATMDDAIEGMSAFFEKREPIWKES